MVIYLLRYVRMIVGAWFLPKMALTETSKVHFIAWPFDCEMKALNGARAFAFMDNARMDFVARSGMFKAMVKNGWLITLGAQRITYFRPIPVFGRFSVESRIVSWVDRWFICECKIFYKGKLAAIAHQRALMKSKNGSITAQQVAETTGYTSSAPPLPEEIRQWVEMEDRFYKANKP